MITKFELYENFKEIPPSIGYYVIIEKDNDDDFDDNNYINYINTSIGYIWKSPGESTHIVKYNNIPDNIKQYFQYSDYSDGLKIGNSVITNNDEIKYWSKDKEDLIPFIQSNKYNL